MGLFSFLEKKQDKKLNEIKNSDFGMLSKGVFCTPIKALNKICDRLDCPAHLAFVPSPDNDAIARYPVYTLKILLGEINAYENSGLLDYDLSQQEEESVELLQMRYGLSESEARSLHSLGIQYTLNDSTDTVEFSSENIMSYLKYADVYYHLKVLGQTIHEEVPNAYVSSDSKMVFVMLNGNQGGKYEEK